MTFPKTMTGLAAKASDGGQIQIVMVHKGQRKASLLLPAKEAGGASAIVLAAASASYAMHKNPPPLPSRMENTPVLQVTRVSIGWSIPSPTTTRSRFSWARLEDQIRVDASDDGPTWTGFNRRQRWR